MTNTQISLADFVDVTVENCDRHVSKRNRHYYRVEFVCEDGTGVTLHLHFSDKCKSIVQAIPVKRLNQTERGPFLMPNADGTIPEDAPDAFVDWHFEQPDSIICIDAVTLWSEYPVEHMTEEQNDSLVEQIIEYLEAQPAPYTGD